MGIVFWLEIAFWLFIAGLAMAIFVFGLFDERPP